MQSKSRQRKGVLTCFLSSRYRHAIPASSLAAGSKVVRRELARPLFLSNA